MGLFIAIIVFGLVSIAMAVFCYNFFNTQAVTKLTAASDDIAEMLLDTDYIIVKLTPYSWENSYPEYGLFTKEQVKAAGLRIDRKTQNARLDDYGSKLPGRLLPRAFLSRLQRVKLGAYTLDQLHQDCQDESKKALVKQKQSKSI